MRNSKKIFLVLIIIMYFFSLSEELFASEEIDKSLNYVEKMNNNLFEIQNDVVVEDAKFGYPGSEAGSVDDEDSIANSFINDIYISEIANDSYALFDSNGVRLTSVRIKAVSLLKSYLEYHDNKSLTYRHKDDTYDNRFIIIGLENDKLQIFDTEKKKTLPNTYTSIADFENGLSVVQVGDLEGVVNKEGRLIVGVSNQMVFVQPTYKDRYKGIVGVRRNNEENGEWSEEYFNYEGNKFFEGDSSENPMASGYYYLNDYLVDHHQQYNYDGDTNTEYVNVYDLNGNQIFDIKSDNENQRLGITDFNKGYALFENYRFEWDDNIYEDRIVDRNLYLINDKNQKTYIGKGAIGFGFGESLISNSSEFIFTAWLPNIGGILIRKDASYIKIPDFVEDTRGLKFNGKFIEYGGNIYDCSFKLLYSNANLKEFSRGDPLKIDDEKNIILYDESGYHLMNVESNKISKPYDSIEISSDKYFIVEKGGKYGFVDKECNEVVPPIYDKTVYEGNNFLDEINIDLEMTKYDRAIIKLGNGNCGIIDSSGKIYSTEYKYIYPFKDKYTLAKTLDGKFVYINLSGKIVLDEKKCPFFNEVSKESSSTHFINFSEGFGGIITKDFKLKYFDYQGNIEVIINNVSDIMSYYEALEWNYQIHNNYAVIPVANGIEKDSLIFMKHLSKTELPETVSKPTLIGSTPENNKKDVRFNTEFTLSFDKDIEFDLGQGNINIRDYETDKIIKTYNAISGGSSGDIVYTRTNDKTCIKLENALSYDQKNPSKLDLEPSKKYYVEIESNTICSEEVNNKYENSWMDAVNDKSKLQFTMSATTSEVSNSHMVEVALNEFSSSPGIERYIGETVYNTTIKENLGDKTIWNSSPAKYKDLFLSIIPNYRIVKMDSTAGLKSIAFKDEASNNIKIVYQSVNSLDTMIGTAISYLDNKAPSYIRNSIMFYNNVKDFYPNSEITVTGFLNGGLAANYVGVKYGVPSVTFDSVPKFSLRLVYSNEFNNISNFIGLDDGKHIDYYDEHNSGEYNSNSGKYLNSIKLISNNKKPLFKNLKLKNLYTYSDLNGFTLNQVIQNVSPKKVSSISYANPVNLCKTIGSLFSGKIDFSFTEDNKEIILGTKDADFSKDIFNDIYQDFVYEKAYILGQSQNGRKNNAIGSSRGDVMAATGGGYDFYGGSGLDNYIIYSNKINDVYISDTGGFGSDSVLLIQKLYSHIKELDIDDITSIIEIVKDLKTDTILIPDASFDEIEITEQVDEYLINSKNSVIHVEKNKANEKLYPITVVDKNGVTRQLKTKSKSRSLSYEKNYFSTIRIKGARELQVYYREKLVEQLDISKSSDFNKEYANIFSQNGDTLIQVKDREYKYVLSGSTFKKAAFYTEIDGEYNYLETNNVTLESGSKLEINSENLCVYKLQNDMKYLVELKKESTSLDEYKVTFDNNGGIGEMDEYTSLLNNYEVILPECKFYKNGYRFNGWLIDHVLYSPGDAYKVSEDMLAYAQWELIDNNKKIVFKNDEYGVSIFTDNSNVKDGTSLIINDLNSQLSLENQLKEVLKENNIYIDIELIDKHGEKVTLDNPVIFQIANLKNYDMSNTNIYYVDENNKITMIRWEMNPEGNIEFISKNLGKYLICNGNKSQIENSLNEIKKDKQNNIKNKVVTGDQTNIKYLCYTILCSALIIYLTVKKSLRK